MELLFVGLGNPGSEYEKTRHNIGWMVLEAFVKKHKGELQGTGLYRSANLKYAGKQITLIEPLTFMNLSGKAVKKVANENSLSTSSIIILVDEYNFPLGKVHLRQGGSDGGHNGVASVMNELGVGNFYRLRFGIEKNFGPGQLVDYVLSSFNDNEIELLEQMIDNGVKAMEHIIKAGVQRSMSDINSAKIFS
jgi:PTH1 family peptidyl-tRNA hydrolase